MKLCAKCKIYRADHNFFADKSRKDGLQCWCKICKNIRAKEHYQPEIRHQKYKSKGQRMITKNIIKVKPLKVYLSAKTEKGDYGQTYNLSDRTKANYVPDLETAKQRFMDFYNYFE